MAIPGSGKQLPFSPKADAAILLSTHGSPPTHPQTVGPIYDPENVGKPIEPWDSGVNLSFYPPKREAYAPAPIPVRPKGFPGRYLRPTLAENERLRLSMLWYYTRDILQEGEFLAGLQEKASFAQEATGWEFVVIGILDVNFYIRLATVGLSLGILPRGETICAHTVTQPPNSVFLLPSLMEDWRFRESPYLELGGLRAYAGAPLRLQHESGGCVGLGSLCVAASTDQDPLTRPQQQALVRLADWVVSDLIQCARARRQRARRRMVELISLAQAEAEDAISGTPVLGILKTIYLDAVISVQSQVAQVEIEGRSPISTSDFAGGLWEDDEYINNFIAHMNHQDLPSTRAVRILIAHCESASGSSLLVVASKDFQLVFDDIDSWFVQTCADMLSKIWHKQFLTDVMRAKEKFLRGFSHQLRTPIHGILGSVELLAEELQSWKLGSKAFLPLESLGVTPAVASREPSTYLKTIKMAGRDLIAIVNSMITLDRWADVAIADRCPAVHTIHELETELINEAVKVTTGDARYNASIFFNRDPPRDCDSLWIDLGLLRDCLAPLLINAVQNTPDGIVIVTSSIRSDCRQLIIDIEDTGTGIPLRYQQRVFDPYEKVNVHSTGAGLGLTIASKFAALLHGSVVLVSSDADRGSHFRATFQEIDCVYTPLLSPPVVSKLKNIPARFHSMNYGHSGVGLCDYFTRFLTCNGFTSTDREDDCLSLVDFAPGVEQDRRYLSQLSPDQVAICLVPASEEEARFETTSKNVVYLRAPFLVSTMISALEEADELLGKLRSFRPGLLEPDDSLPTLSRISMVPSTDEVVGSAADLSYLKSHPHQPPAGDQVNLDSDPTAQAAAPGKPRATIPVCTAPTVSSRPTVLIVDDNAINLRILEMYCARRGLSYCCAADGLQAVEAFSRRQALSAAGDGDAIQLTLMDLQMPLCDGIEATRKIRLLEKENKWRASLIFIVTGQDSPIDRSTAENAGADGYFVKPVGVKLLDNIVKQHFPAFNSE